MNLTHANRPICQDLRSNESQRHYFVDSLDFLGVEALYDEIALLRFVTSCNIWRSAF